MHTGHSLTVCQGLPPSGGSPWQGVVSFAEGVSLARGVSLAGGLLDRGCWGGGGIPACTKADPPVNRMTNRCKNITLATTSLRPVIICPFS